MNQFTGIIGIGVLLGIAYLLSENRKAINYRTITWGLGLQLVFALLILKTPIGKPLFSSIDKIIIRLIDFADKGSEFVFGSQVENIGFHPALESVAFRLLPTIIFFSALISAHLLASLFLTILNISIADEFKSTLVPLHPFLYNKYVLLNFMGWKAPKSTNFPVLFFLKKSNRNKSS